MAKYRNIAFISYSHRDMKIARWLQRRLEAFRLPTEIHNDVEGASRYLRPVFRDKSDVTTGILTNILRENLADSKYLIVICSENSAQSQWVSDEVEAFIGMGRLDRIIPVVISDGAKPEPELFPKFLRKYISQHKDQELLGVNLRIDGREKAVVRIASRMLDVSFDTLWQRHQRQKRARLTVWTMATVLLLGVAYVFGMPVGISVDVDMENSSLPTGTSVRLTVNGASYESSVSSPDFSEIRVPGYKRFDELRIALASQYFTPADTILRPGICLNRTIRVTMHRDSTFAVYGGTVFDEDLNPIPGVHITVAGEQTVTDSNGLFHIDLPLQKQQIQQTITLESDGYVTMSRADETPSPSLSYIMHRHL